MTARVGMTEQELRDHVARLTRALEEEREWRLRSAGTLLAAETRAHVAESEVTRLQAEVIRLQGFLLGSAPVDLRGSGYTASAHATAARDAAAVDPS